jgi:hypothetical protein
VICSTVQDPEYHIDEYSEKITSLGPYILAHSQPESGLTEIPPMHKGSTNKHAYEYLIREIINNNSESKTEKLGFYFAGFVRGYNIGYTAVSKNVTTEIEEMRDMLEEAQLRQIIREELGGNKPTGERLAVLETKAENIEAGINDLKKVREGLDGINQTLIKLDARLTPIEKHFTDQKEKWKAWLPSIFAGACTIIAALIAWAHP